MVILKLYIVTMLKCPVNKLLVTIEKKYQDKLGNLFIDTSFFPEEYATLKGIVTSVPNKLENEYWRGKTDMIIETGDEVWFSYGIIFDYKRYENGETPSYKNLITYKGQEYWKVDYNEVFCVVRDGKILIPTEYILLEPIADNSESKTASGLVLGKKAIYSDRARVVAAQEGVDCKPGDIIPLESQYIQQYNMLGKVHYIVPSRRLIAKY